MMKKQALMKQVLTAAAAVLCAASLAACSAAGDTVTTDDPASVKASVEAEQKDSDADPANAPDKITTKDKSNENGAADSSDADGKGAAAASVKPKNGKQYKVGVIQMIENGAFNDMREGFIDELRKKGFSEDQMTIDYKNAQGDATNLQTIAQGMADGSYDLVATVATPPTQAMVNAGTDTPVIFVSVSDPIAAGVISDMEKPDKNATGTSNAIPVEDIFKLSQKLTPNAKTFGFLYCTSEVNSVSTVKAAKEYCDANGIPYKEAVVTNSSEVQQAAQSLADEVDAIFIPNDSVIQSAMTLVSQVCRDAKIPTYASSATTVQSGAFATIAISDKEIGAKSADMAIAYLDGKAIADIPSIVVPASATVVNEDTMKALGLSVPDDGSITFVKDAAK